MDIDGAPQSPRIPTRLALLGDVAVGVGDQRQELTGSQPRLVLSYLTLERHRPVTRDELAEVLWPEDLPGHWSGAIRGLITQVRRFLADTGAGAATNPGAGLRYANGSYHLALADHIEVDVELAGQSMAHAEQRMAGPDLRQALEPATVAAELLRCPLLAGDHSPWLDEQRRHLQFQRIRALHVRSIALSARGDAAASIEASEEAVAVDPLDEASHQALLAAHLAAGSAAGALRAYERCRTILDEELGCRPGPGTESLYRRALNADNGADADMEPETTNTTPNADTDGGWVARVTGRLLAAKTGGTPSEWQTARSQGDQAMAMFDYRTAIAAYEQAIQLASTNHPAERARLQTLLGAALRRDGRSAQARSVLRAAVISARDSGDVVTVAEIVLELVGGGGRGVSPDLEDGDRAELLTEALAGLGAGPMSLRIQVMAELSLALLLVDPDRSLVLAVAADHLATVSGHPSDTARAMVASRLTLMFPIHADRRLKAVDDVIAQPGNELTSELLVRMLMWRMYDHAELGDREGFDEGLTLLHDLADRLGQPYWRWIAAGWSVTQIVIDGDLERAEACATASLDFMAATEHPEVGDAWAAHLLGIRVMQGRGAELTPTLADLVRQRPAIPAYRAALALVLAQGGQMAEANAVLDQFLGDDAVRPARDTNWSGTLGTLAVAAHLTGHKALARHLIRELEPHAARMVVLSLYGGGAIYLGPVALHLGRLSALVGQPHEAHRHLTSAEARAAAFGSGHYAAEARAASRLLDHPNP